MTTTLIDPAPQISHRFAPVHRGRGYHRVGGAVVASGKRDGTEHKLIVGLERVAVATVTYRASQAAFEAIGGGGEHVLAALRAVAAHADLTGRAELSVKVPWPRDSGTDVDVAAAWAAVAAFCEATDTPATASLRRAVTDALGGATTLPGAEGIGVFDTRTGSFSSVYDDAPRFGVLLWHQPGSRTDEVTGVGTLPSDDMPTDLVDAAAWLSQHNGAPQSRLGQLVAEVAADDADVLGVIGGHTEKSSVGLLLAPGMNVSATALRLRHRVAAAAGERLEHSPTYVISARG